MSRKYSDYSLYFLFFLPADETMVLLSFFLINVWFVGYCKPRRRKASSLYKPSIVIINSMLVGKVPLNQLCSKYSYGIE
jgi:hypothetical protein